MSISHIIECVLEDKPEDLAALLHTPNNNLTRNSTVNSPKFEFNSSLSSLEIGELLSWTTSKLVCGVACSLRWYGDEDLDEDSEYEEDNVDPWLVDIQPRKPWKRPLVEAQHFLGKVVGVTCPHDAGFNILQLSMCLETDAVALQWLRFLHATSSIPEMRQMCLEHLRASFGNTSHSILPPLPFRARMVETANTSLHLASFLSLSNIVRYLLYLEDEFSLLSGQEAVLKSRIWKNRKNTQGYKALDCCIDDGTKQWFFLVNDRASDSEESSESVNVSPLEKWAQHGILDSSTPMSVPPLQKKHVKRVRFEKDALFLDACKQSGECACQGDCPIVFELIRLLDWPRMFIHSIH
jgi:hypothetical protein